MASLRTVLVPLDGSPESARVLEPLRRLLRGGAPRATKRLASRTTRFGPALVLLHVAPTDQGGGKVELELAKAKSELEALCLELELDGLRGSVRLARGDPVEQILSVAADPGVDLVAMSTHGRAGAARLVRGSVAEGVLRQANLPVLLVNPHTHTSVGATGPVARVLVPIDGTDAALEVLPAVAALARASDAEVLLLRVRSPGEPDAVLDATFAAAKRSLEGGHVGRIRPVVAEGDSTAATILGVVETERVDLVAMTTHGRKGFERLWVGSVAEEVARTCVVPVLIRRLVTP